MTQHSRRIGLSFMALLLLSLALDYLFFYHSTEPRFTLSSANTTEPLARIRDGNYQSGCSFTIATYPPKPDLLLHFDEEVMLRGIRLITEQPLDLKNFYFPFQASLDGRNYTAVLLVNHADPTVHSSYYIFVTPLPIRDITISLPRIKGGNPAIFEVEPLPATRPFAWLKHGLWLTGLWLLGFWLWQHWVSPADPTLARKQLYRLIIGYGLFFSLLGLAALLGGNRYLLFLMSLWFLLSWGWWCAGRSAHQEKSTMFGLAALLILALVLAQFPNYIEDDAYISATYAHNIATGQGAVLNPGERIEGYTNFLVVLLEALSETLGLDGVLVVKFLSALALLGIGLVFSRLQQQRLKGAPRWVWPLLIMPVLFSCPSLVISSTIGLESLLFSFFIVTGLALSLWPSREASPLAGALLGLACLTRPDGYFFFGLAGLYHFIRIFRQERQLIPTLRQTWRFAGWGLLLIGLHLAFRLAYYHELVPNTYFAKRWLQRHWHQLNWKTSLLFCRYNGGYPIYILALAGLILSFRTFHGAFFGLIFAGYFTYLAKVSDDWMPFYRFYTPIAPWLLFFALEAIRLISQKIERKIKYPLIIRILMLLFLIFAYFLPCLATLRMQKTYMRPRELTIPYIHDQFINFVRLDFPDQGLIATDDIGKVSLDSGKRILDLWGLSNDVIAQFFDKQQYSFQTFNFLQEYVLALMPEYVYVTTQNLVPYTRRATPHIAPLLNHPDFEKYYEFCFILKLPSIKLYKQMYRRRDLADPTFVIPSEQNRLLLRATTLYYIDHYAEACELLQAYIGKYPKDFLGYYDLGFCFAQQDKRAEALAAYRKSLEINPGHELSQRMIEALSPTPAAPKP